LAGQDPGTQALLDSASAADLDHLLTAQLAIAWAGESGEELEFRLGWWETELCCEDGGEDLFLRLTPGSWAWATLQSVRESARRTDAESRGDNYDPDSLISLYRLGFMLDERAEERLSDLKRTGRSPQDALPGLRDLVDSGWSPEAFGSWVKSHGKPNVVKDPVGVRLRGKPPSSLRELVDNLVAAHWPFPDSYPLPHYRRDA